MSFPGFDDDVAETAQCESIRTQSFELCRQAGGYCQYDPIIDRPYECKAQAGLGSSSSDGTITCKLP